MQTLARGTNARRGAAVLVALAMCLLALLAAGGASGAPGTGVAPGRLLAGVNLVSFGRGAPMLEGERALVAAHQLHARIVRIDVPWSTLERAGPGQIDPSWVAYLDRLGAVAGANGIKLVMTVGSSPCWASSAPRDVLRRCVPDRESRANSWPPREASAYAAFVAFLAQRYGPDLAAIEVWNEPDQANEDYFGGRDKAAHYATVLRAAYPAVKAADPNVKVLGGSLVGSNGIFLRALYAAGIKGYYDGLSVHFYTLTLTALREIHEVQLANGDTRPLWLDEFGWTSCWPRRAIEQEQGCVTAQTQTQNITNMFSALDRLPYLQAAILYKLRDSSGEEFGVMRASGARKTSFGALARVLAAGGGSISPVTLRLSRQGNHVLVRGSAAVGDLMQMEVFQGSLLRYRALFVLDRFNGYSIALPPALGTSGLRVRVFQGPGGATHGAVRSI